MDFSYTEEQLALQETLQRFIARDYGFERRRELSRSTLGYSADAWSAVRGAGIAGAAVSRRVRRSRRQRRRHHAGDGADRPGPAAGAVLEHGGDVRRTDSRRRPPTRSSERCCREIGAGKLKLALACYEAAGRYDLSHVACTAAAAASLAAEATAGGCRAGKRWCSMAPSADYFLVSARSTGQVGGSCTAFRCSWSRARRRG